MSQLEGRGETMPLAGQAIDEPGAPQALTEGEARAWREDGFFLRPACFDADELAVLRDAAETAARTAAARVRDQGRTYFLDGKRFVDVGHVTVQFEHSPGSETIRVIEPVAELEPRLEALVEDPRLTEPVRGLLGTRDLALWTDKLNLKRAGEGSGFGWHQDAPYWTHACAHPDRLPNVYVALDAADAANGCLRVVRGSHRAGALPWTDDGTQLGGFYTDPARVDRSREVLLEVPAGSLVFFDPWLVHGSGPNGSATARRALVVTYQPGGHPTLKARRLRPVPDPGPAR
jgi:hypothetical protein